MQSYERIAEVCHEVNKAWCEHIGDTSQVPWSEAGDWQRLSAIKGVEFLASHPDALPSTQHDQWLIEKQNTGWIYGPIKDPEFKTHPCMVDWNELPDEQRFKDVLFGVVAKTLLRQQIEMSESNSNVFGKYIPNDGEG